VGEAEILRDDALRLAVGAEKAGVTVRLEREPEMPHDWHMLAGVDPRGQRSIEALSAFLRARLDAAALG
jgi:acetyl esterase/lipase